MLVFKGIFEDFEKNNLRKEKYLVNPYPLNLRREDLPP